MVAVVVMGATGVGKTTVGLALAEHLGRPFVDADELHSKTDLTKMVSGAALTDDDPWPWLAAGGDILSTAPATALPTVNGRTAWRSPSGGIGMPRLFRPGEGRNPPSCEF